MATADPAFAMRDAPDARGVIHAPLFGLDLQVIDGPKLRIGSAAAEL